MLGIKLVGLYGQNNGNGPKLGQGKATLAYYKLKIIMRNHANTLCTMRRLRTLIIDSLQIMVAKSLSIATRGCVHVCVCMRVCVCTCLWEEEKRPST